MTPAPSGLSAAQDLGLQRVGVLVLVDQHVIEARADLGARAPARAIISVPVEQQVVVVEQLLRELGLDVLAEQPRELVRPLAAPRKTRLQRALQRLLRVHAVRVDRETRVLARKALLALRRSPARWRTTSSRSAASPRSSTVKAGIEAERSRVQAQQAVADRVKRAGPRQAQGSGRAPMPSCALPLVGDARCARRVISCAARRVNVSSRMRSAGTPASSRCATRCASVVVLPVPAPAMISSGPATTPLPGRGSPWRTAWNCAVLRLSAPELSMERGTIGRACMDIQ